MQLLETTERNGTNGRVYGGDENLVHIADGTRAKMGMELALMLDQMMRAEALANGSRTDTDAMDQALCPGCYMVALFDAALALARMNGQDVRELGRTMAAQFDKLAHGEDGMIEEIEVIQSKPIEWLFPHMDSI